MKLFTIDTEKCKKDGFCAKECPRKIIDFTDKKNVPIPTEDADELCINCGHCVTVCPYGALTHKELKPEDCVPIDKGLELTEEQAMQFFKSRRSIRNFKKKQVDRSILDKLLDIARYAPTGHNSQPVQWLVTSSAELTKGITGQTIDWMRHVVKENPDLANTLSLDRIIERWEANIDTICREAPHMFIVYGQTGNPFVPAACTIAMTHLEMAAPSFGLGACWAGYAHAAGLYWPPMKQFLNIPEDQTIHGVMMIGEAQIKYHRIPDRNQVNLKWI